MRVMVLKFFFVQKSSDRDLKLLLVLFRSDLHCQVVTASDC